MLVENLEEYGIKNVTIHEFIIPKELNYPCKSAYSKYKAAMESARGETVSESREKKRKNPYWWNHHCQT